MEDNRQLLANPDPTIHFAAPNLRSRWRIQRPTERWRKLTRREIVERLVRAQGTVGGVICGGGRILEREFMQLDHKRPRAEGGANDISNRILLRAPRNGRKSGIPNTR